MEKLIGYLWCGIPQGWAKITFEDEREDYGLASGKCDGGCDGPSDVGVHSVDGGDMVGAKDTAERPRKPCKRKRRRPNTISTGGDAPSAPPVQEGRNV